MLRRVSRISPGGSAHTVVIARGDKLDGSSSGQDAFVDPSTLVTNSSERPFPSLRPPDREGPAILAEDAPWAPRFDDCATEDCVRFDVTDCALDPLALGRDPFSPSPSPSLRLPPTLSSSPSLTTMGDPGAVVLADLVATVLVGCDLAGAAFAFPLSFGFAGRLRGSTSGSFAIASRVSRSSSDTGT